MTQEYLVQSMYTENSLYNGPEPMTEADAAYNLLCYRDVDGIDIPEGLTPLRFCFLWNQLYKNDMTEKGN